MPQSKRLFVLFLVTYLCATPLMLGYAIADDPERLEKQISPFSEIVLRQFSMVSGYTKIQKDNRNTTFNQLPSCSCCIAWRYFTCLGIGLHFYFLILRFAVLHY